MSVNITGYKQSISCGYAGFFCLRCHIAELISSEFAGFYMKLFENGFCKDEAFLAEYETELNQIMIPKYSIDEAVVNFLYQPDCDGSLSPEETNVLWNLIKSDSSPDFIFGKKDVNKVAKWSDFRNLVENCVRNGVGLEWY